ncbi:TraC family protein [Phyllobacterium ifriqiyense]|uniref:TraC family protein n=1 Tax=Phyllobacterium ifriqiyense TaxID=314238 RepID=UPI0033962B25
MKKPSAKIRQEIALLQDQLRQAETREAERIGRLALKAGIGDIAIDEDEKERDRLTAIGAQAFGMEIGCLQKPLSQNVISMR